MQNWHTPPPPKKKKETLRLFICKFKLNKRRVSFFGECRCPRWGPPNWGPQSSAILWRNGDLMPMPNPLQLAKNTIFMFDLDLWPMTLIFIYLQKGWSTKWHRCPRWWPPIICHIMGKWGSYAYAKPPPAGWKTQFLCLTFDLWPWSSIPSWLVSRSTSISRVKVKLHSNEMRVLTNKQTRTWDQSHYKTPPLHHNCLKPCHVMTCLRCGVDSTGSLTSR